MAIKPTIKWLFAIKWLLIFSACNTNIVIDKFEEVGANGWQIADSVIVEVEISDTVSLYDLSFNLRHRSTYQYSNLYVLMSITNPDGQQGEDLLQFKLAENDGKWKGKSNLGDLITHQIPLKEGIKFSKVGVYRFVLQQYMRIDPLPSIVNIGLKVARSE